MAVEVKLESLSLVSVLFEVHVWEVNGFNDLKFKFFLLLRQSFLQVRVDFLDSNFGKLAGVIQALELDLAHLKILSGGFEVVTDVFDVSA